MNTNKVIESVDTERYIVSKSTGKILDLDSSSSANGAKIQQWQRIGGDNQKWKLEDAGDGYYYIVSKASGKVLDLDSSSSANGAKIQQWQKIGGDNQKWKLEDAGNGYYYIVSKASGKVLDLDSSSSANGAKIQQWQKIGGDNQKWKLELVKAWIFIHAPNGDFLKSHEDTIINYITWGGENWTAKVEGNKFIHAPNGDFLKSHEDTIINYITWGGENWTAKVEGNKFIHASNGDFSKSHVDTIINYVTWGGTNWTAKKEEKPTIQFGSASYDVQGSWNHMVPYTRNLIDKIQRDPTQLKIHVENGIRTSRFLHYIQEGGENVFGDAHDRHGNPVKLARWTDKEGHVHECQLKVGLNPAANAASTNLGSPVPEGGSTGQFIVSSQGNLCFAVQKIKEVASYTDFAIPIVGALEWALVRILTRSLVGLRSTAENAALLAELPFEAGVDAESAAAKVVRVEGSIKWVKWGGTATAILGVLVLLVQGFFALFHKMTFSLEMWNETDVDLEWSITYQAGDTHWINNQNGLNPKDWQQFPKKNAVDDGLIPLGGGLDYDKVAAVGLVFANGSKDTVISAAAIKACVSIRQKGGTENVCVVLIDAPLVGHNKMHLGAGKGDESYYNSKNNSATDQLSLSFNFTVGGKRLTAQISTDQVSGETNYGGITGYNYNALLYIKEATS